MGTSTLYYIRELLSTNDAIFVVTLSAALGVGLFTTISVLYLRFFSPLAMIKGPFWASVSKLWFAHHVIHGDLHQLLPQLHRKYGSLVRILPDTVSISDPDALKAIYGIKSGFTKTDFYDPFEPHAATPLGDLFTIKDEKVHAVRRRLVSNIYSMSNVLKSEQYINKCTAEFKAVLHDYAAEGKVMDFGDWLQRYTFDVIGELYYGSMFGFLEERRDIGSYIHILEKVQPFLTLFGSVPALNRIQPLMATVFPSVKRDARNFFKLYSVGKAKVEERIARRSTRTDMLANLFSIQEKSEQFSYAEIVNDSFNAIAAGSDTTAVALRSIFYHILKNPAVYMKLQSEIDEACQQGKISTPCTFLEAAQMPYLSAVCKEGMRIFPSVSMILPRYVPEGGRVIAGVYLPERTRVGISAFVVHQDKAIFGEDAADFNPDRWFREEANVMDRYMFQFGGGSRSCIGKNISLCEIHKLVPEILRNFTLRLASPETTWKTKGYWFAKQSGIDLIVSKRT